MKKVSIFDLDGTLINAYDLIFLSLNEARKELGYGSVDYIEIRKNVGGGDISLIKKFFKNDDIEKAIEIYRNYQQTYINERNIKLMKGAKELLIFLKDKGLKISIATNRNRFSIETILKGTGIKEFFDFILTADDVREKKPSPEILEKICEIFNCRKEECFYVGDMDIDLITGKKAGIDTFIVLTGSSIKEEIFEVDRNARIFSDLLELKKFLISKVLI